MGYVWSNEHNSIEFEPTVIAQAKVLVVGAGGIGCELLKTLILSGFENIHVIDLDTIDLSNLNRQFLFRREHIGQPKALIAVEMVQGLNAKAKITAQHVNVYTFGPSDIKEYTLVINALDNLGARRHVNRLCLSVNIPLIESGTQGYLGQTTGESECYECEPPPVPKQFAVCTIRSNPTEPIHCIHWAKMLYSRIFGKKDDLNAVSDIESCNNDGPLGTTEHSKKIFNKVFYTDIVALLNLGDKRWEGRKPPEPLLFDEALELQSSEEDNTAFLPDQQILSIRGCAKLFVHSILSLYPVYEKEGEMEWDKDNDDALNFVVAAANIRSYIFTIRLKSRFDIKSMAGNIIPAIATTNAIVAGLMVVEAMKIVTKKPLSMCRAVYVRQIPAAKRILVPIKLPKPNPECYICGRGTNFLSLAVDTTVMTLGDFIKSVLQSQLSFNEPMVVVNSNIVYECGEGMEKDEIENYDRLALRPLKDVGITHGSMVKVDDFTQDFKVDFSIENRKFPQEHEKQFEIKGSVENQKKEFVLLKPSQQNGGDDDKPEASSVLRKRKYKETEEENQNDDIILLDDDDVIL